MFWKNLNYFLINSILIFNSNLLFFFNNNNIFIYKRSIFSEKSLLKLMFFSLGKILPLFNSVSLNLNNVDYQGFFKKIYSTKFN